VQAYYITGDPKWTKYFRMIKRELLDTQDLGDVVLGVRLRTHGGGAAWGAGTSALEDRQVLEGDL
jgi:hypothetical protein